MLDLGAPHGRHYYWKSRRLATLDDEVIGLFMAQLDSIPTPFSQINGYAVGGAVSRVAPDATAVGEREPGFEVAFVAGWPPTDPEAERHVAWVRAGWSALAPHGAGAFTNFLSDEGAAGVRAAYGERLARLTAVKDAYDPTNVFRLNANIPPTGWSPPAVR
jgi:FAD/FMN-containing dehydrogenase